MAAPLRDRLSFLSRVRDGTGRERRVGCPGRDVTPPPVMSPSHLPPSRAARSGPHRRWARPRSRRLLRSCRCCSGPRRTTTRPAPGTCSRRSPVSLRGWGERGRGERAGGRSGQSRIRNSLRDLPGVSRQQPLPPGVPAAPAARRLLPRQAQGGSGGSPGAAGPGGTGATRPRHLSPPAGAEDPAAHLRTGLPPVRAAAQEERLLCPGGRR